MQADKMGNSPYASELELQSNDADKITSPAMADVTVQDDKVYIKGIRFWLIFTTFVSSDLHFTLTLILSVKLTHGTKDLQ